MDFIFKDEVDFSALAKRAKNEVVRAILYGVNPIPGGSSILVRLLSRDDRVGRTRLEGMPCTRERVPGTLGTRSLEVLLRIRRRWGSLSLAVHPLDWPPAAGDVPINL